MDKRSSSPAGKTGGTDAERSPSSWRDSALDEAMEEIFHPSVEQFSLADLRGSRDVERTSHYDENDYQLHRMESLHHHQPLHRLHHHHHRRSSRTEQEEADTSVSHAEEEEHSSPNDPLLSKPDNQFSGTSKGVAISPRTADRRVKQQDKGKKASAEDSEKDKVQFFVGSSTSLEKGAGKGFIDTSSSPRGINTSGSSLKSALKVPKILEQPETRSVSSSFQSSGSPSFLNEIESSEKLLKDAASLPAVVDSAHFELEESSSRPKVTFLLGEEAEHGKEEEESGKKHYKERHERVKHYRRYRSYEDSLSKRQHQGSDLEPKSFRGGIEPEEAETLQTADIDDIVSHRFEDPRAIRRHKIQARSSVASFIHLNRKDGMDPKAIPYMKKLYKHKPHEVFVELDELVPGEDGEELEWKETARWIKYEEDVEEGADRWGKPHVASLSFHSLLNLRKCIEKGTILLDLEERDLPGISYRVVESMVVMDQIKPEDKGAVMRALLLRHRHVNERGFAFGMRRNSSGYANLNMLAHERKSPKFIRIARSTSAEDKSDKPSPQDSTVSETKILVTDKMSQKDEPVIKKSSSHDDVQAKLDTSILRRIPVGAEATIVLVGALNLLEQPTIAFVRLAESLVMPNLMEVPIPVRFIFILLGPINVDLDYHEIGRSISTLMSNRPFHDVAYKAEDRKDLLRAINEFLDNSIVLPPGDWERQSLLPIQQLRRRNEELKRRKTKVEEEKQKEAASFEGKPPYDPLRRTHHLFGGLISDAKNRYPWYWSDIRDGLNAQCFATALFMYFAALSGAITFGGLIGDKTEQLIGVSETLITTSACGIIFTLLAGQPLVIIGITAPVLLFDEILHRFCKENKIDFLAMRVWTSFWVAVIATVVVAFEGCTFVRYFTRFTQEIFSGLVSLLYIYECFNKWYLIFLSHPLLPNYCNYTHNESRPVGHWDPSLTYPPSLTPLIQPNTALLSTFLMIGTFCIAYFFRNFRHKKYLGRTARRILSDFGVPIAITSTVLIDYSIRNVYTQKLSVPEGMSPTSPDVRGWLIKPLGVIEAIAVWQVFAAVIAALLIFILLFLEIQICELIISKKERKLRKGSGFHLDLLLISYMEIGCALIGGPWMCAATVRSVSHVAAVTVMSKTHAPGETPHIVEVKEQRVSNFIVSLLVGISVLMGPILRKVPVAVLFGIFLYMGVSSMGGIQFFERLLLFFTPVKHHPDVPYVQQVRTWRMHMYTCIQLLCFIVLWIVKSTDAALAFPFVLLMMVPVRIQLKCCFTEKELAALDGDGEIENEDSDSD